MNVVPSFRVAACNLQYSSENCVLVKQGPWYNYVTSTVILYLFLYSISSHLRVIYESLTCNSRRICILGHANSIANGDLVIWCGEIKYCTTIARFFILKWFLSELLGCLFLNVIVLVKKLLFSVFISKDLKFMMIMRNYNNKLFIMVNTSALTFDNLYGYHSLSFKSSHFFIRSTGWNKMFLSEDCWNKQIFIMFSVFRNT